MSADGARKLFVGGLADSVSEDDLRTVFEGTGFQIEHLALPRDRESGRLRGFAFITLVSEEEANRARTELSGVDCCGRPLSIREFSQDSPKRGPAERTPRQPEPTVFLGKLPFDSTPEEIQELFTSNGVGPVTRVTLPAGPDGRPRGFGFATLASPDLVDLAVEKVNGATLGGRQIVVSPAQPRGAGAPGGPGPRSEAPPRGNPRYSDHPPPSAAPYSRGGDSFGGRTSEPPMFPPQDAGRGARRRGDKGGDKKRDRDRRGGGGGSAEGGASAGGPARGERKRRGGGGNWHQWEDDDD